MKLHAPTVVSIIAAVYLVGILVFGIVASRRTRNLGDYYIAGRSAPRWVAIVSGSAAVMSGFGLVGIPGLAYAFGGIGFILQIFSLLGFSTAAYLSSRKLRTLAEIREVYTIPDTLALRYPRMASAVRLVGIAGIIVGLLGYLSVELQALGVVLSSLLPVSYWTGALLGLAIVGVYTIAGGIKVGIWTDLVQFSLEMAAGLIVLVMVFVVVGGPFHALHVLATSSSPTWRYHALAWWPAGTAGLGIGAALAWMFEFGAGMAGQPQLLAKYYVHRDVRNVRYQALGNGITMSLAALMIFSGLAMAALTVLGRAPLLKNPDYAAPYFFIHFVPPWLAGIAFTALLAASMATINGFSNILSASITRDFMQGILHRKFNEHLGLLWGRVWTLVMLVGAAVVTYFNHTLIGIAGAAAFGLLAAVFLPTVSIGLNWRRGTSAGVVASGVIGVVGGIWATVTGWNPGGVFGIAIVILASLIGYVVVSLITPAELLDPAVDAVVRMRYRRVSSSAPSESGGTSNVGSMPNDYEY